MATTPQTSKDSNRGHDFLNVRMLSILHVMPGSDCSLVERQVVHGWSFLFDVFAEQDLVVSDVAVFDSMESVFRTAASAL